MSPAPLIITARQAAGLTFKFVLFQFGFFILVGIAQGVIAGISGQHLPASSGVNPLLLTVVNTLAAFLVLRGQLKKSRLPWSGLILPSARWVRLLPWFLLIIVGEIILVSESGNLMTFFLPPPQWLRAVFSSINDLGGHPWSGPFVLMVVAPVTEECLFRGLILRGLLTKTNPMRAVVISALLFAAMHLNPWQMPGAFLLGIIFGWAYLRTRSLTLCMLGHGLHNSMVLLAAGLPFTVDGFNRAHAQNVVLFQPWWFNLLGLSSLAIGVYIFHRTAPFFAWTPPVQSDVPPPLPLAPAAAIAPES